LIDVLVKLKVNVNTPRARETGRQVNVSIIGWIYTTGKSRCKVTGKRDY
jgi:hypothetical protein